MAFQWALLGDAAEDVIAWLDARHLGRIEAAGKGVDREVTMRCWETLSSIERDSFEWRPWLLQVLPEDTTGKETLKEFFELRRHLNTIPENWAPQIRSTSPSSLQLSPSRLNADAISTEDGLQGSNPLVPSWASVPLALGINLGTGMSAGIQIQSEAGCANEGVWLGLEIAGAHEGFGECMSILCAPLTGRCMQMFPGRPMPNSFISQAMPPLAADFTGSVEIYVTVEESGDFEFVRFCHAAGSIARSGRMVDMLPPWTTEIFAAINIKIADVPSDTRVSAKGPMGSLVQEAQNDSEFAFDAEWSLLE
jgi:hypothetical protein